MNNSLHSEIHMLLEDIKHTAIEAKDLLFDAGKAQDLLDKLEELRGLTDQTCELKKEDLV